MKNFLIVLFLTTSCIYTLVYYDYRCELDKIRSKPIEINQDSIALYYIDSVVSTAIYSDTVNTTDNINAIKCKQYERALYDIRYQIGLILPLKKDGLYDSIITLQIREKDQMIKLK